MPCDTESSAASLDRIDLQTLRAGIDRLLRIDRPRFQRLWAYYRNVMRVTAVDAGDNGSDRPYRQEQEWGLPSRITGARASGSSIEPSPLEGDVARKEVVIENDIGWRVDTMVDYLFGRSVVIDSAAVDPARRAVIGKLLRAIVAGNGGIVFFQQLALIGSVHGFVDVLVKFVPSAESGCDADPAVPVDAALPAASCSPSTGTLGEPPACAQASANAPTFAHAGSASGEDESNAEFPAASDISHDDARLARLAAMIRLEIVEPARALPLLNPQDWRVVDAYAQVFETRRLPAKPHRHEKKRWIDRLRDLAAGHRPAPLAASSPAVKTCDLVTPTHWFRFEDEKLAAHGENSLGQVPLVHVQNVAVPFQYGGASDVEPLIPLQDELNTRLSDRANRITLQSFRMYLGKGIENFTEMPIAPGQMWQTDNEAAEVISFGGDASCPSEESHIAEIREAMDKCSGVTPIAAGAIKGRIGRLTSAAALRVTMLALLAKTEKKRTTYGSAIEKMCELALLWLDRAGVFPTTPDERKIDLHWPSPLPENQQEKLDEAQAKLRLGIEREIVLRELGY